MMRKYQVRFWRATALVRESLTLICVEEAKVYIQQQEIVAADETGFNQANIDGGNPQHRQAWLWVAVTPLVTFFEIALTRISHKLCDR